MKSLIESLKRPMNAPVTLDPESAGMVRRYTSAKRFGPTTIDSQSVHGHRAGGVMIHASQEEEGVWSVDINGTIIVNSEEQLTSIRGMIDSTLKAFGKSKLK